LHAGLIYFLSSQPVLLAGPDLPHMDKLAHASIFGLLAFLVAWGLFRVYPEFSTRKVLAITVLVGVCYGALDEFHQYFVPQRMTDPLDLLADAVGTLLVVAGWWYWRRGKAPLSEY
jgi:VanZ family protein